MAWVLTFVLSAPALGALLLHAAVRDRERRRRALHAYFLTALFLHPIALVPAILSIDAASLVLATFDGGLLAIVIATWRDERALEEVLAAIRTSGDDGARRAARWMRELASRHGGGVRVEHALACARALEDVGRTGDADAVLESIPRAAMTPREAARVALALALLALDRGDAAQARERVARALGRAPSGAPEIVTARMLWAFLDALDGLPRRALAGLARAPRELASPQDRALAALTRAHALAARGDAITARTALVELDREARALADRWARACAGPGSGAIVAEQVSPYR